MAIKENSNMRLIHKSKLSNRLLILCVADIIVVLWIMWNEGRIQYEPLLDYNLAADTKTLPLDSGTYNTTVLTIVSNIIVLIIEIKKKYTTNISFVCLCGYWMFVFWIYSYFIKNGRRCHKRV